MEIKRPITFRQWKGVDPPEIDLRMAGVEVWTATRRIRAEWTVEMAQDLAAFTNIDAETELTALLAQELGNEIDRNIILDLRLMAGMNAILEQKVNLSPTTAIWKPKPFRLNNREENIFVG